MIVVVREYADIALARNHNTSLWVEGHAEDVVSQAAVGELRHLKSGRHAQTGLAPARWASHAWNQEEESGEQTRNSHTIIHPMARLGRLVRQVVRRHRSGDIIREEVTECCGHTLVVTAFMRSGPVQDPMNRVTTNGYRTELSSARS